jgi:DNA polymerase bacteriophage-type
VTFPADQILWVDFEVKSEVDLKAGGTFRYVADATTSAIVLAYAVGDAPALAWHADGAILDWDHAPPELRAAVDCGAILAAWHASFDTAVWNYSTLGFSFLAPERVIDPMIQAGVANLPTDLESASRALGGAGKQKDGKALIKTFCVEGVAPAAHPEEWQRFLTYARQDVEAMREVYRRTRPLPLVEWQQYWAFEHVNRRGIEVDVPYVRRAAALAAEDGVAIGRRLAELTDGAVTRVTLAQRLVAWLHDQLADPAMREVLICGVPRDDDDDDDDGSPPELSLARDRVARVLAMLEAKHANGGLGPGETKAFEAATLRLYGAGAAPKKFARLEAQQVDGVLRGQYRFAGAGQTGRATSRGAQIQNLTRDVLGEDGAAEAALVDAIAAGCTYAELVAAEPIDVPAARKLALLVRPAIIARSKMTFVWSDWAAIEARVTPWLAASLGADRVLDIFRASDRDPALPDIYTLAAADILHKNPGAITRSERAIGKVACIAEGEPVLTNVGLVPIEKVTTAMRIWDGLAWVNHDGVVCRGVKDVITYDGLTATADHVVFTAQGELQFGDAATRGARLIQSGAGRAPLRACENHFGRTALRGGLASPSRRIAMCRLRRQSLDRFAKLRTRHFKRLSAVFATATNIAAARSDFDRRKRPLHDENAQAVEELRRPRHRVSIPLSAGSRPLGFGESRRTPVAAALVGSSRQRQSLQAWKPALGDTPAASLQHSTLHPRRMGLLRRRVAICIFHRETAQAGRSDTGGNLGAGGTSGCPEAQRLAPHRRKARVFDLLNAGPRQRFTVSSVLVHNCLALGFGGSIGALQSMALNYRIHLEDAEARRIVAAWRDANPWAREFWGAHRDGESFGLWGAALRAWEMPGEITSAGRLAFVYREDYLGGSLFMALPSGRLLTYPRPRWRETDILDRDGKPTGEKRTELSFRRAHGRAKLWHGTLCENAVQAVAADILRETVTRIETDPALAFMPIRMTTHDEIVVEVEEARAEEAKARLRAEMLTLPDWAAGLPLQSEERVHAWYTKSKSKGG